MRQVRYRQIGDMLRSQILSGRYQPGDRLPTEQELASTHGVSRITAAAALTALARDGLVQRIPRRGTIVLTPPATRPAPARPTLALIQPGLDHPFGMDVLVGMELAARGADFSLQIVLTESSLENEDRAIRRVLDAGVSGLALTLQDGERYNAEVLRLVLDRFPLVLIDRFLRGLDCACVQSDNIVGTRALINELIRTGHQRICALTFPPSHTSTIEDRLEGYYQALAQAQLPVERVLHYVEKRPIQQISSWEVSEQSAQRFASYLERSEGITAIFASNAWLALLALRACALLSWRVPDDISIVSIDPAHAYPIPVPVLTYAQQSGIEIGQMAVELLQEQLQGRPPRHVMLPMTVVKGTSVRAMDLLTEREAIL